MSKRYLFIDRDGTLIHEPSDFQIDSVEKFKLMPDLIPSLLKLKRAGFHFVMITNQDGLGTENNPQTKFDLIQNLLLQILESQGIFFEAILICPHVEADRCVCRKPNLGLVRDYLANPNWDRKNSAVIGDRKTDLILAENMGIRGLHLGTEATANLHSWKSLTELLLNEARVGHAHRKTKETDIQVNVKLDGDITAEVSTGIGFFDHMLEQLSKHGGFSLEVKVKGDLHIDDHHTVEDTALAIGAALKAALGDKVGIQRYGFYLPMDDASSEVSLQVGIDLSGRSYFKFDGQFDREKVGELATEMIPHFFKSLADGLGCNLHLKVDGHNTHHKVEASFKAVGRALRMAIQKNSDGGIPSTKGAL